ncbi:hypothetical protein C7M84_017960 [Penaeus vannamei]|uniref:Uncharacterized protein n=1 Tax=Penaeus vannamei TaxID=6689 RepID=A0A3R7QDI2_PENVA|nr:hypothetical protein C7M84_017960 [Penaeus vannamei]
MLFCAHKNTPFYAQGISPPPFKESSILCQGKQRRKREGTPPSPDNRPAEAPSPPALLPDFRIAPRYGGGGDGEGRGGLETGRVLIRGRQGAHSFPFLRTPHSAAEAVVSPGAEVTCQAGGYAEKDELGRGKKNKYLSPHPSLPPFSSIPLSSSILPSPLLSTHPSLPPFPPLPSPSPFPSTPFFLPLPPPFLPHPSLPPFSLPPLPSPFPPLPSLPPPFLSSSPPFLSPFSSTSLPPFPFPPPLPSPSPCPSSPRPPLPLPPFLSFHLPPSLPPFPSTSPLLSSPFPPLPLLPPLSLHSPLLPPPFPYTPLSLPPPFPSTPLSFPPPPYPRASAQFQDRTPNKDVGASGLATCCTHVACYLMPPKEMRVWVQQSNIIDSDDGCVTSPRNHDVTVKRSRIRVVIEGGLRAGRTLPRDA